MLKIKLEGDEKLYACVSSVWHLFSKKRKSLEKVSQTLLEALHRSRRTKLSREPRHGMMMMKETTARGGARMVCWV
jgi:hypothetical protein